MMKLSILEFLLRTIPESFLFILASYLFARKNINEKLYFISSMVFAICIYLIRMLPINFGVHTIISIIIYILISVLINNIPIIKVIPYSLILIITLSICEWTNLFIINILLKVNINSILTNPFRKIIYLMPSLILFAFIVLAYYLLTCKINKGVSKKCT